jgi:membrane protein DedA with SNARE-associated domain
MNDISAHDGTIFAMPSLDAIAILMQHYGYWFLFPIAVVEGPIITVIAALLAAEGYLNVFAVFGIVVLGDMVGDLCYYAPGRWGKKYILRWGHYVGVRAEQLNALEERYRSRGGRTILFGKWTHSAGFLFLIAAGAAEMPIVPFLWYNLIGTLPKSLLFTLIGYFVGYQYNTLNSYLERGSLVIFILLCFVGYYVYMRTRAPRGDDQS